MLEVGALAPLHQGFRGWPVETEMPVTGIVVDRFPPTDAGEERIHHHKFFHFGRELRGVSISDHQADVVSYHPGFLNPKWAGKSMNSCRRSLHVQAVRGNRGISDSRQIWSDD